MKRYLATCVLRNGARCVLTFIGTSSWSAIDCAFETFGDRLLRCSARPAP